MQLKSTKEKLLGSRRRGAKAECAAGSIKEIKRIFKRICRKQRKAQLYIIPEIRIEVHVESSGNIIAREITNNQHGKYGKQA